MNAMLQTKLRNYFLGLFLFIFLLLTSGASLAQTPPPVPTAPQIQINPNSDPGSVSAQFDQNAMGITCGIPESLNRNEGTRCCNINASTGDLLKDPEKLVPKFFCISDLPGFGAVEAVDQCIDDPVCCANPFCEYDTPDPETTIDLCLSEAATVMMGTAFDRNPLVGFVQPPTAPQPCIEGGEPTISDYKSPSCKCVPSKWDENSVTRLCMQYMGNSSDQQICKHCASSGGYWTGIGCIKTDIVGFTGSIIGVGMGVGGAATLLCIIYAAFILQTSRGNPEKIKKAQESLRACISGLLLIIFSIFILQLIGVTILQIPGLS